MARVKTLLEKINDLIWYDLLTQLKDILKSIYGLVTGSVQHIQAGTNITLSGTGTTAQDPLIINATAGGGSQNLQSVLDTGNTASGQIMDLTASDDGQGGETGAVIYLRSADGAFVGSMTPQGFSFSNETGGANYDIAGITVTTGTGSTRIAYPNPTGDGTINIPDAGAMTENFALVSKKPIRLVPGTSHLLVADDANYILHFTANSDVTLTVQAGLPLEYRYEGRQYGTGQILFTESSTTVETAASELPKTAEQRSAFTIDTVAQDVFFAYGKLELA